MLRYPFYVHVSSTEYRTKSQDKGTPEVLENEADFKYFIRY
jgi:hypothetical protein